MGYQALLFCPDDKLARVVSQVFSELDFAIESVREPFAAVKRLMAQRFDAIVVDCENEQNASLLFKSARNSSSNQNSLAIALVEGQSGVAKAYRIGANLVLTKPINVEQAKGTLRVARGLLRKNADAAGARTASSLAAAPPTPAPASTSNSFQSSMGSDAPVPAPPTVSELPEFEAPLPATIPVEIPPMTMTASAKLNIEEKPAAFAPPQAQTPIATPAAPAAHAQAPAACGVTQNDAHPDGIEEKVKKTDAPSIPAEITNSPFASALGSAAATAPARELAPPLAIARETQKSIAPELVHHPHDAAPVPAPTFGFGSDSPSFGAVDQDEASGSGGSKKILIGAVAVLALAVLGYFGYTMLGKSSTNPDPQPVTAPLSSVQPAPAPSPVPSPGTALSTGTPGRVSSATPPSIQKPSAATTAAATTAAASSASAGAPPTIRIAANPEPTTNKPSSTPIFVKTSPASGKRQSQADESASPLPSPLAVDSANDAKLSGLMTASPSVPKPTLATLRVSQGVSQGLVIKRVQPKYPQAALAAHIGGAVQIEATINKEGNVTNLKVLNGDPLLAHAAVEAVRQWRYKPYYLNSEPVEIETQITVNFKAN